MSADYLEAPPIGLRKRIPEQVIGELVRRIADQFHPQQVILFGSHARGNPGPESDVDLLVIMDTPVREVQQALTIRQAVNPLFGVDILVYTPERVQQRLAWGDSFLRTVLKEGIILYESADG